MAEILAKRQYIFLAHAAEHIIKLKYKKNPLKTSAIYDNIFDISVISHFGLIFVLIGRIHLQITHVHEDLASVFLTNKRARKYLRANGKRLFVAWQQICRFHLQKL